MANRGPTAEEIAQTIVDTWRASNQWDKTLRELITAALKEAIAGANERAAQHLIDSADPNNPLAVEGARLYADEIRNLPPEHHQIAGAKPEWKTIDSARKDGTPILVCLDIPASEMHDDLKRWQGVIAVMRHPGVEAGSFDIGWNMAAPVGHGGFPDRWIAGWQPIPDPPNLPPEHQDEGK